MEGKIHLPKKPAAGAARIGILYRSPPLKMSKIFGRGGSVENYPDLKEKLVRILAADLVNLFFIAI